MFCQHCGAQINDQAEICVHCGVRVRAVSYGSESKSKTAAILLAIFFGHWAWLYTHREDGWKFWVAFTISVLNGFLLVVTVFLWLFLGFWPIVVGLWLWAVIDTVVKPDDWYINYSQGIPVSPGAPAPRQQQGGIQPLHEPRVSRRDLAPNPSTAAPAARGNGTAYFIVKNGELAGQHFGLNPQTTIGRSASGNDIVLPDKLVSREHALVRLENNRFVFMDRGAVNRSFLVTPDGQREITKHVLRNGDELLLGDTRLIYKEE